jgi:protein-S-isoprenylcysteine O-methyltransferase Ste14
LSPRSRWWPGSQETRTLIRAVLIAGAAIYIILEGLFLLASILTSAVGLPALLHMPLPLKLAGAATMAAGLALGLWLLRFRRPSTMIVSTHLTFMKMLARAPVAQVGGRTERLVVGGPQRYVRHPLYLAAAAVFFGWALVTGATASLVWVVCMLLWFGLVQIPFEERELIALFGDQYRQYAQAVPMLIPFTKRRHTGQPGASA